MYSVAWYNRVEFIHPKDIAIACKNALTADCVHEVHIIAGGPKCQSLYYDQIARGFELFKLNEQGRHI